MDKVSGGGIWNQVEMCSGMGMDFERLLIISIQSETLVPFPGKGINYCTLKF